MTTIHPATEADAPLLSVIASLAFLESHGHSAKAEDNHAYIAKKLSTEAFESELRDTINIFSMIYVDGEPAGYSKIILNAPHPEIEQKHITKMERLYLLKSFYGQDAGKKIFDYNISLSREHHQLGMWLHVWKENHRAIAFYQKQGFKIIGSYDFEISPTHFNPNHLMYLAYQQ